MRRRRWTSWCANSEPHPEPAELGQNADIPLGRVGRSEEFADLAAYLLSDRSSYVTGSAVNLDGGTSPVL